MKSTNILVAVLAFVAMTSQIFAESEFERECKQLKSQRDKDIASASEPIDRRYKDSLEQLLRSATLSNDLDGALRIKKEIELLSPAGKLQGTKWKTESAIGGTVALEADGVAINPPGTRGTWKYSGGNRITITWDNKPQIWTFDPSYQFIMHADGSKWNRVK